MPNPDWLRSRYLYIATHACVAALFVFALQAFAFKQSFEWSALWGACFGVAAAALAWRQTLR